MKIIVKCLILVISSVNAFAQTRIQTEFVAQRGWIYLDYPRRGISFDSVANPSRQYIPIDYIQLADYKVVLYGTGAIYVFKPGQ
ncbi:hypothetical protein [Hymenobacter wooponensis]|uniref:Uncharacterized protein n=1 Tax=Hymenobacter wooponensis TaxID=1525360 RepID=A0A4Z0MCC3_9BACT|nr:hypothetical protein [Hymenobacter wooponensis]TGD77161.1 hypothetical protein EU557_24320 [Hymenobacter wooponensis]